MSRAQRFPSIGRVTASRNRASSSKTSSSRASRARSLGRWLSWFAFTIVSSSCQELIDDSPSGATQCVGPDCSRAVVSGPSGSRAECQQHADCPADEHCALGTCVEDICQPGTWRCDLDAFGLLKCNEDGSGYYAKSCTSGNSCVEGPDGPNCQPQRCVPNAVQCELDTHVLMRCDAAGLNLEVVEDCAQSDQLCAPEGCYEPICEPSTVACIDGAVQRCNPSGTELTVLNECGAGAYCNDETTSCALMSCSPGELRCLAGRPALCDERGVNLIPQADCEVGTACHEGACAEVICEPLERVCHNGHPHECDLAGTTLEQLSTCAQDQVCVDGRAQPSCEAIVCFPGQTECVNDVVWSCNALGTASEPTTDCTTIDSVCLFGSCKPVICVPEEPQHCEEGSVVLCKDRGTRVLEVQKCSEAQYCEEGTCKLRCPPGSRSCSTDGWTLLCAEDGSDTVPQPVEQCMDGQACDGGECLDVICDPGGIRCDGQVVYACPNPGTRIVVLDTCLEGTHCEPGNSRCVADAPP